MGKSKAGKDGDKTPHRHLHCRISFLHQAATYLGTPQQRDIEDASTRFKDGPKVLVPESTSGDHHGQRRHLLNQIRGVSRKSQIRLTKDMKHSLCKRCDSLLVAGVSSSEGTINESRGERKPAADIFEVKCNTCGTTKRFPVGQQRQRKEKAERENLPVAKKQRRKPCSAKLRKSTTKSAGVERIDL